MIKDWLRAEATLFEIASGAALAIGIVGVLRGGRDVWLGVALIVLAGLFLGHGSAIHDEQDQQQRDRLLKHIDSTVAERMAHAPERTPPAQHGLRAWLKRVLR
jgi:hypothetical protein